jgi:hypothetical protein
MIRRLRQALLACILAGCFGLAAAMLARVLLRL